jgi:hypothetical protein
MLRIVPEISKETMAKILNFLPEPTQVHVKLFGGDEAVDRKFTESFLKKYPDLDLKYYNSDVPEYSLTNPTKSKILELAYPENFTYDFPRTAFHDASFEMEGVNIELDFTSIKISYSIEGTKKMLELLSNMADLPNIETIVVNRKIKFY